MKSTELLFLLAFMQYHEINLKVVFASHFLLNISPVHLYQLPFSVVYIFEIPYRLSQSSFLEILSLHYESS